VRSSLCYTLPQLHAGAVLSDVALACAPRCAAARPDAGGGSPLLLRCVGSGGRCARLPEGGGAGGQHHEDAHVRPAHHVRPVLPGAPLLAGGLQRAEDAPHPLPGEAPLVGPESVLVVVWGVVEPAWWLQLPCLIAGPDKVDSSARALLMRAQVPLVRMGVGVGRALVATGGHERSADDRQMPPWYKAEKGSRTP
jgi:hypothetical protein